MGFRVCDRLQNNGVFLVKRGEEGGREREDEEEGKEELRNEEGERKESWKIQCVYNVVLEDWRRAVGENRWKENKRQRRKERRETRSGLRHRKRFHLEGWQHPRSVRGEGRRGERG